MLIIILYAHAHRLNYIYVCMFIHMFVAVRPPIIFNFNWNGKNFALEYPIMSVLIMCRVVA